MKLRCVLTRYLGTDSFYMIGKILNTVVQGAMDVLTARAKIKAEMRLDVTTIKSKGNNPTKFSFSAEEALARLLTPHRPGYMPPSAAIVL